ncbi:UNVERIFIED_CONTAM: hypothetical protein H355_006940 [Colinus virginianus]|nr:hypothetical protein H355_006940 [Colinus virginianus]
MGDARPDKWHAGERCLAPCPENGKFSEGTILSIEKDKNGKSFAIVSFLESEDKKILISKLSRVEAGRGSWKSAIFDDGDLEKPYFPDQNLPSSTVAFKLSDNVLYNWKDELDTWGYFKVSVLHGSKKEDDLNRIKQGKCEVALTTYETLRLYLDEFNNIEWSAVIVDEVHRIKNPKSQITQTMKSLKCSVRIGLTGTILQNNMKELWCVMDWAVPGLLGSRMHFKKKFSDPVERGQRHTATKRELATGRKAMVKLARKMSSWFLRRTKVLISDQLPKKEDRMVYCSLTEFQKAVYEAVLKTEDMNSHGETIKSLQLSYLTILQKVANHVALLQTDNTSKQQETHIKRVCNEVFSSFPDFMQLSKDAAFETISDPKYSGKMKLLDVLEQYCMASGLDFRRLDGNTKSEDRIRIVREFNRIQEINICLVSTMAGGLGLNFVGANVVILFDPTWNPANDLQAIDRAYRIGQCKDVKVFRLISLGTVEEMMYLRQVYKQQLHCAVVGNENAKRYFEAVQGSKEHQGELFGIHNLFKLRTHGSCLTKDILEREGQVEAGVMTYEQPDYEGARGPSSTKAQIEREETDFCDYFSDDDILEISMKKSKRMKPCNANNLMLAKGQLSLMQCGFFNLLQREIETTKKGGDKDSHCSGSDSQTVRTDINSKCNDVQKCESYTRILEHREAAQSPSGTDKQDVHTADCLALSDSEEEVDRENEDLCISQQSDVVMETESSSEENCDVIFPTQFPSSPQAVHTKKIGIQRSASENSEESLKEEDEFVPKEEYRQSGFHGTESNFSKVMSFVNMESSRKRDLKGASDISDESDDIEVPCNSESGKLRTLNFTKGEQRQTHSNALGKFSKSLLQKKKPSRKVKESDSQNIDEFSSSEDNLPVEKIHTREQRYKTQRCRVQFRSKKLHPVQDRMKSSNYAMRRSSTQRAQLDHRNQNVESMDRYLDGVQEVAYMHSNQNVVGSSKAESHLSRWAMRDVFELKQFSQLPANVAVCSTKKAEEKPEEVIAGKSIMKREHEITVNSNRHHLLILHPVTQRSTKVHRVGSTTFLVGKTPKEIRRRQFEEIVSHFKMGSVEELAEHIAKATSETRQKLLREFYISKYPETESLFPVEVAAQVSNDSEEEDVAAKKSRKRKCVVNSGRCKSRLSSAKEFHLSGNTELQNQRSHEVEQLCSDSCLQDTMRVDAKCKQSPTVATQHIDRSNDQSFEDFMASGSLNSKSEITEVLSVKSSKGEQVPELAELPKKGSLSQLEDRERTAKTEKSSFVDLLGDTSILNVLFRNGEKKSTESPRRIPSGQVEKSKEKPKDFWDMLNEQNEESLRKLTDTTVIKELCERAPHPPLKEKRDVCENSLWKKNENFLWKKYSPDDSDEPSSATSFNVVK